MEALVHFTHEIGEMHFPIFMFLFKAVIALFIVISIVLFIYDRYIQRENQLLINYPLIGRMRYLFYAIRDPMRQYFGDEKFYESFDKVKWVYDSAERKSAYASFSPGQPQKGPRLGLKNANCVLNTQDVSDDFSVTFGKNSPNPFKTRSVFGRSAMSDGAISPEGTRSFTKGAYLGKFPINTGEGSLTSNFFYTHKYTRECKFFEIYEGTFFAKGVYKTIKLLLNGAIARKVYKHMVVYCAAQDSYLFDKDELVFYRVNWDAHMSTFPSRVPNDMPDIIFQTGSGLYGVRDKKGNFCEERYQKTMRFCKMTEIKMAQGAKQTGGKLLASKVSEEIAYYRGVEAHKDLFSPNQFPFAHTIEELFDFIGRLKALSEKPVGVKIVISSQENFTLYADLIQARLHVGSNAYPDFITIDGGDGGSGTAPLEMMMSVGCIRARECSGAHGRACPVGLATQDKRKRASFLVEKKAINVASYHGQMLAGIRGLLAVMGLDNLKKLNKKYLVFKDHTGKTYMDVDKYFEESLIN